MNASKGEGGAEVPGAPPEGVREVGKVRLREEERLPERGSLGDLDVRCEGN